MKKFTIAVLTAFALVLSSDVAHAEPVFWVRCEPTITEANIDPIVAPGGTSSHSHVFFGTRVRSTDTGDSLRDRGRTNCSVPADFSGYWVPTVRDAEGNLLTPDDVLVYYRKASPGPTVPFPQDFGVVSTHVFYSCGKGTTLSTEFRFCPAPTSPRIIVIVRPMEGDPNFPEVRIAVRWTSYEDVDASTWVVSSDSSGALRHGDFLNGWTRRDLRHIIEKCINVASGACGRVDESDF